MITLDRKEKKYSSCGGVRYVGCQPNVKAHNQSIVRRICKKLVGSGAGIALFRVGGSISSYASDWILFALCSKNGNKSRKLGIE